MTLDPQAQAVLDRLAVVPMLPLDMITPAQLRHFLAQNRGNAAPKLPVADVEDRMVPVEGGEIPIRLYKPEGDGSFPALVFYHGGGWVFGSIESHDPLCRALTNLAECMVISVDYRLAPEVKFPIPVEDSYAALQWVYEHHEELQVDPSRIAIGGDSAGGNLATVVAHLAKERGMPPIVYQVLIYPATDMTTETESRLKFDEGYLLTRRMGEWMRDHYLSKLEDQYNPLASPMLIQDLSQMPPTLVITGEYDPLRDEGEAYGNRLREAGVPTRITRYPGMIHGFITMAHLLDKGREAISEVAETLQEVFREKRISH